MEMDRDLAAELPPRRDDEPESLRQDIIDELTDHLHCALQRELLSSGGRQSPAATDEQSAWQHVLTRFGDPAAVVRRLWFDAMKERLMTQKLTLGVATLACVLIGALLWRSIHLNAMFRDALNKEQAQNASLLEELRSFISEPDQAAAVDGWVPLDVRLVSEEGKPVKGLVRVSGRAINAAAENEVSVNRETDAEGIAHCGMLPYGNYDLIVSATAAGEDHTEHFMLAPGQPSERTVVCPSAPLPKVDLRFAFNPPDKLHAENLRYQVALTALPRELESGHWTSTEARRLSLWVDADGRILSQVTNSGVPSSSRQSRSRSQRAGVTGFTLRPVPPLRAYEYRLDSVSVCVPAIDYEPDSNTPPADEYVAYMGRSFESPYNELTLIPQPAAENLWTIEIPDNIWERAFFEFRGTTESRYATIPDGWETVTMSQDSQSNHFFDSLETGDIAGVVVYLPDAEQVLQLLDCVHVIAKDRSVSAPTGNFDRQPEVTETITLLVTPEHKQAIEEAQRVGVVHLRKQNKDNATEPVLHQDVLDKLKELPDREVPKEQPGAGGG